MSECIHEMDPASCAYCKPKPMYQGAHWDAKYPSECAQCGIRIEVGDRIRWTLDGTAVQHSKHK